MKATYITVTVSTTDDSLFGPEDAPENYNVRNLLNAIYQKVKSAFPKVEVEVVEGDSDSIDSDLFDYRDIDTISHIIQECWEAWIEKG
ncbi:MAG: DinI family protein [Planctomycetaceae bacterium]|nr:DinI family protein [Planctomycetaceae bacterium]